jgi:hypothetical protein
LDLESSTNPTVRLSSSKNGIFTANEVMSSLEFHSADSSGAGAGVRSAIRSLSTNSFGSRTELTFSTTDASTLDVEAMRIDSDGNVGIGTAEPTEKLDINGDSIRIRQSQTPSSATATGTQGQIAWDANYMYVCTATNTWKRVALATW